MLCVMLKCLHTQRDILNIQPLNHPLFVPSTYISIYVNIPFATLPTIETYIS